MLNQKSNFFQLTEKENNGVVGAYVYMFKSLHVQLYGKDLTEFPAHMEIKSCGM